MSSSAPPRTRRAGRLTSGTAIREAAAALFLEKGYQATSMDDVAAAAQVSKQTIYTHFAGKEELFADLVLGNAERVDEFVARMRGILDESPDVERGLHRLARIYLGLVMRPDVLRLRRLVMGEVGRFPELARAYYERVPGRVIEALSELFDQLARQAKLRVDDPIVAAQHFAWLTLGTALDRAMFYPIDGTVREADLDRIADAAARAFLAAYGVPPAT
ncbi:MAG TPA: TetR/AcrR family transcriptional regulator [Candidatus Udaeobacter sp.]|nr:TetR/AcrR family transcriptional regulator [Candidatus Udaeobacter sp.]